MLRLDINLLFTVINLLILYVLMKKFLFGPVNAIIAKRQEAADAILTGAKEKETEAEELKLKYDETLSQIQKEEAQILDDARKKALEEHDRIVGKAEEEATALIEQAKERAASEQKKIVEKSREDLTEAFLQAGEKLYMTQSDEGVDAALYQQFLDKVGEE